MAGLFEAVFGAEKGWKKDRINRQNLDITGFLRFSPIILRGHSHVSLPIHLGYDFMTIAERIGHDDIKYIMETYGHLYPEKHLEVVRRLEQLESEAVAQELEAKTAENKTKMEK